MVAISVCMIAYNHEKYIREAIEGVLMQTGNFNLELVVSDDTSSDKTSSVIQSIIDEHPRGSDIKFTKQDKNLGMIPNFIWTLQQCKGDYIAICEGDDYWTDSLKLQKQLDFLEHNPDYVIHSGIATILNENGVPEHDPFVGIRDAATTFGMEDFLGKNNLITCTVMFRNCITQYPEEFFEAILGDWFLYTVLLHQTGLKAYRSSEELAVYRVHNNGFIRSLSSINYFQQKINQVLIIKQYIGYKKNPISVIQWLNNYSIPKFRYELAHKMYRNALKTFITNIHYCKFGVSLKRYLSVLMHNKWR
ncbi:glycosyltransferase [Tamlana flava]|uniref:glycosyltransferase n=1 Tax=Tamlana flava TaxID=3158572 RepID=UPI00351AED54